MSNAKGERLENTPSDPLEEFYSAVRFDEDCETVFPYSHIARSMEWPPSFEQIDIIVIVTMEWLPW